MRIHYIHRRYYTSAMDRRISFLLAQATQVGVRIVACQMSLDVMGLKKKNSSMVLK